MGLLGTLRVMALAGLFVMLFAATGIASAAVEWCEVGSPPPMQSAQSQTGGTSVGNGPGDPSAVNWSAYQTALVDHASPNNGKGMPTNYTALANAAGGMTAAKSATGK